MFLGEHPVVVPAAVAALCGLIASYALWHGAWVVGALAYGDAVGMAAIAAHSRVEGRRG